MALLNIPVSVVDIDFGLYEVLPPTKNPIVWGTGDVPNTEAPTIETPNTLPPPAES